MRGTTPEAEAKPAGDEPRLRAGTDAPGRGHDEVAHAAGAIVTLQARVPRFVEVEPRLGIVVFAIREREVSVTSVQREKPEDLAIGRAAIFRLRVIRRRCGV